MTDLYRDPDAPLDDRVEDLLARMTVTEKAAQLTSLWLAIDPERGEMAPQDFAFAGQVQATADELLADGIGHLTRPLGTRPLAPDVAAAQVNSVQRRLVEGTRLGIPAICHEECLAGLMAQGATSFPAPLNLASTWDPDLVRRMTDTIRRQMRAAGSHQGLAPVADVARDARWGRVEETLGEDAYLVGVLVSAYVTGLQGPDLADGVVATLKHFAGYSFSEGGRNFAPVHAGRREMLDTFLLPFEMAVTGAGALGVMPAYVAIDGEPAHASRWLLTEVLRDRWGFEGAVVSDYGGVSFLRDQHRVATDRAAAVAASLRAGLDVELPQPLEMKAGVAEALQRGLLDPATLDQAVRRVLRLKVRLGLFESPYAEQVPSSLEQAADRVLARVIAVRSITLLHNDGTLPLRPGLERLAVVGPNAADPAALFGNYSFENHVVSTHFPDHPIEAVTVLDELRQRLGPVVTYARGARVMDDGISEIDEAVAAAAAAEVAVVVVGDRAGHFRRGTVGEGTDTDDLSLPGGQGRLLEAVLDTGTPVVLVLLNGRPFALSDAASRCAAVVEAWFPGQEGASAIVDVLTGVANPAGRSPLTFSRSAGVQPRYHGHTRLARGVPALPEFDAVFPFGHGLSYTTFDYRDLAVPAEVATDGAIAVAVTVENSGHREGDEVVQIYARDLDACVTRPVRQLVGFARISLEPGGAARVTAEVPIDLLSYTGPDFERMIEPGPLEILVGSSSADIRLSAACLLTGGVRLVGSRRLLQTRVEVVPL